jgi:hypothetical protein
MLALLLVVQAAAISDCVSLCDVSHPNCYIFQQTCHTSADLNWEFDLIQMTNSKVYIFSNSTRTFPTWTVKANILSLVNSTIYASYSNLTAGQLTIDANSKLSANGTGAYYNLGGSFSAFYGGSYGGFGGCNCDQASQVKTRGSQWYPVELGSGVQFDNSSTDVTYNPMRGGGVIQINAASFSLDGEISAAGNRPLNDSVFGTNNLTEPIVQSGSGGSVLIFANFTDYSGFITVAGGSVSNPANVGKCGGGGGRVAVYSNATLNVITMGGVGGAGDCAEGGAGTFYSSKYNIIITDNGNMPTNSLTLLEYTSNLTVTISRGALVVNSITGNNANPPIELMNLYLNTSSLKPCYDYIAADKCNLTVIAQKNVQLTSSGTLGSTSTSKVTLVVGDLLSVDSSSSIVYVNQADINSSSIYLNGELLSFFSEPNLSVITITCKNFVLEPEGFAKARYIGIKAQTVIVEGTLQTQVPTCNSAGLSPAFVCFDLEDGSRLKSNWSDLLQDQNYTLYIEAVDNITLQDSSKVIGARLGICTNKILIQGLVSSNSFGCPSGAGQGAGQSSTDCAGSGGGYGGVGGWGQGLGTDSTGDCADLLPGQPYSSSDSPWYEGSGGGSVESYGGPGGGLIMVAAYDFMSNSGVVESNGGNAISSSSIYSGGGSGGSVIVITSELTGDGFFGAQGGQSTQYGGGGSGGRVYFIWIGDSEDGTYTLEPHANDDWTGFINVTGSASSAEAGQNGTSIASSCPPGFGGLTCRECDKGEYKKGYSWEADCSVCSNKPSAAHYSSKGHDDDDCPYECPNSYRDADVNTECRSPGEEFVYLLGGNLGTILVVSIFVGMCGVWLALKLYMHRNNRKKKNGSLLDKPLKQVSLLDVSKPTPSKKQESGLMAVEDLPFHIRRVYLLGHNSFHSPWALAPEPDPEVADLVFPEAYVQFAQAVNEHTQWRRWEYWAELALRVLYFPLSIAWQRYRRSLKARSLLLFIKQYNEIIWRKIESRQLGNSLRLTVSECFTLACIDVLTNTHCQPSNLLHARKTCLIAAGTGDLSTPFKLEKTDCLMQLLGYTLGPDTFLLDLYIDTLNAVLFRLTPADISENKPILSELRTLVRSMNAELLELKGLHASLCVFQAAQSVFQGKFKPNRFTTNLKDSPLDAELTSKSSLSYILKPGLLLTPISPRSVPAQHDKEMGRVVGVTYYWEFYNLDLDIHPRTLAALFDLKVTSELKWVDTKLFDLNRRILKVKARWSEYYLISVMTVLLVIDAVSTT